jgi:UDP-N-acetylmuramoylalanine--D-glutamate ligase
MLKNKDIFFKKKILIYGLGKSGLSTYKFLKKKSEIFLYDDNKINCKKREIKKHLISFKNIVKKNIDYIIISPGINIKECKLNNFLKKNIEKIYTDLDIFYSIYGENKNITITGTNGKSTTAKILYEVLKKQKIDVRLAGNIGIPILSEKKITKKTIFVIEASSYQLEYSKVFRSNIAVILNISPDHLERHKTLKNYIRAKFKLIKNQTKKDYAIINTNNVYIKKQAITQKFLPKIIKVNKLVEPIILKKIDNPYFMTDGNKENLSFILEIIKILKIKKEKVFKILNKFNGLKYRQQIIFKSKNLTIINDSKATSFSSSTSILKSISNVYWIVGGLAKKGDKFLLSKNKCKKIKVYIFGKNKSFFIKELKNIVKYESFKNLKTLIKKIYLDLKKTKNKQHQTILFSPAAASFDNFKNFEERGLYFNNLIKKFNNVKR